MTGAPIFYNPAIREHARTRGIELTPAEVETISTNLNAITTVEGGQVKFTAGHLLDLHEAVEEMSAGFGRPVTVETPAVSIPAGANATARALAATAAMRAGQSCSRTAEAEALASKHGNPWAPRSINRTHQAMIRNLHPALADRLQQQAGARR